MLNENKRTFNIPQREDVTIANRAIFDRLEENVGQVPNLYKAIAYSRDALNGYLTFQYNTTTLNAREKQAVNMIVSQVNECAYSLSAYTQIGKLFDFTLEQLDELRYGSASFDKKLDAFAGLIKETVLNKGNVSPAVLDAFFEAGYSEENLVDGIMAIGEITIANYLYGIMNYPIDFERAPFLPRE